MATNCHALLLKDAKEIKGVAANTRKMLLAGKKHDPFKETTQATVSRVLRDFTGAGSGKQKIVVLNDEAHHCYQDKPIESVLKLSKEQRDENADARVRDEAAGLGHLGFVCSPSCCT